MPKTIQQYKFKKKDYSFLNFKTIRKKLKMIHTDGEIYHVLGLGESTL